MKGMNDLKRHTEGIRCPKLRDDVSLNIFLHILSGGSQTIQMGRFGMKPARSPECAERAWRSQNRCNTPPTPGCCSGNLYTPKRSITALKRPKISPGCEI